MELPQHSHVIDHIWIVETEYEGDEIEGETSVSKKLFISGGGVCVHHSGLIFTVAHLIREDGDISARKVDDSDFRKATLFQKWPQFDLALILLENKHSEEFSFLKIDESSNFFLEMGVSVFTLSHQDFAVFSFLSGKVCYPFPRGVPNPDSNDCTTFSSWNGQKYESSEDAFSRYFAYRTIGHIFETHDENWFDLHPNLPLVQVHGIGARKGASGCPVFRLSDGSLIGLMAFTKPNYEYIIPITLLNHLFSSMSDKEIGRLNKKSASREEKGETSSSLKRKSSHEGHSSQGPGRRRTCQHQHLSG